MARLVLINGAPGSGKSTVAAALAEEQSMALALDVDSIKHSLGHWDDDPSVSGRHARRLSLALAAVHMSTGYDVFVGQYLARPDFIEELERLAGDVGAQFFEIVLEIDPPALAARLAGRSAAPSRPEHVINNRLVGPDDAEHLVESIRRLQQARPRAIGVDARGSLPATLDAVRGVLGVMQERGT